LKILKFQKKKVFSISFSGESGIDVFQREAEKRNICIAIAEKVPSDANDAKFNEVKIAGGRAASRN
jgi:hypothetical protein